MSSERIRPGSRILEPFEDGPLAWLDRMARIWPRGPTSGGIRGERSVDAAK